VGAEWAKIDIKKMKGDFRATSYNEFQRLELENQGLKEQVRGSQEESKI
jgi:hypothetical protein